MPRVLINKKEYILQDLSDYIIGEMGRKEITQAEMAEAIGMKQPSFSLALKRKTLRVDQLVVIFGKLGTSEERIGRMLKL